MAKKVTPGELADRLRAMSRDYQEAAVRGLQSAAMDLEGYVVEAIMDTKPNPVHNNGDLVRSTGTNFTPNGAVVSVDAPHAPFMEYGTRPHRPPVLPLADWAYQKGIIDSDPVQVTKVAYAMLRAKGEAAVEPRPQPGENEEPPEAEDPVARDAMIVAGVVRGIEKNGLAPRHFMARAVARLEREKVIDREIRNELRKVGLREPGRGNS